MTTISVQTGSGGTVEVTPEENTVEVISGAKSPNDLTGPGSATDNAVATFDGTDGKKLQGTPVIVDDSGNMSGVGTLASGTQTVTGNIAVTGTVDGRDIATDGTKLDTIETSATADQSAAEIKTAYESNLDTNAFTDAEQTLLGNQSGANTGDEVAATSTVSGVVELATIAEVDTGTDTDRAITPAGLAGSALQTKVNGIEASADVTDTTNVTAAGALMDSELANIAAVKALDQGVATTDSPQFTGIELGHATDTTLTRSAAGTMAIEGVDAVTISATQTLTNKTITTPTLTLKQSASPTPTAEGDIQWGTDDNKIKIGDGASTLSFSDDTLNREKLTAARTYYVRGDGSDSNDGMTNSAGGAFLTVQKALDTVGTIDFGIYDVTVKLATTTTWTENLTYGPQVTGGGQLIIDGDNTTPANTVLNTTGPYLLTIYGAQVFMQYCKITSSGQGIRLTSPGSKLSIGPGLDFGVCTYSHILADSDGCHIYGRYSYTISGSATAHITITGLCAVDVAALTITFTGSPAFSTAALSTRGNPHIDWYSITKSGTNTGPYAYMSGNSFLFTNGAGESALPGNSAGTYLNGATKDA